MIRYLFILSVLIITSCSTDASGSGRSEKSQKRLRELEWLIGRWENHSNKGNLSEIWERENDSVLIGVSYYVIGRDTVFREKIRLEATEGKVYYKPEVDGQNEGKPVTFTLSRTNDMKWVFENPEHDFPQIITYSHQNDSLVAVISGVQNGQSRSEVFAMKRVR